MPTEDSKWHIDKKVSVGHLVTTLVVAVSMVLWAANLDKRITVNEKDIINLHTQMQETAGVAFNDRKEIKSQLNKMDTKLDRLIERLGQFKTQ